MQWLNCADQKQLTTVVDFNTGAKEIFNCTRYKDIDF